MTSAERVCSLATLCGSVHSATPFRAFAAVLRRPPRLLSNPVNSLFSGRPASQYPPPLRHTGCVVLFPSRLFSVRRLSLSSFLPSFFSFSFPSSSFPFPCFCCLSWLSACCFFSFLPLPYFFFSLFFFFISSKRPVARPHQLPGISLKGKGGCVVWIPPPRSPFWRDAPKENFWEINTKSFSKFHAKP